MNRAIKTYSPPGSQQLNLLIEIDSFDKGGMQKVVLDSALRLIQDGVPVIIVSVGPVGYLADEAKKNGIKVFQLPSKDIPAFYEHIIKSNRISMTCSHFSRIGYPIFSKLRIPNVTFIHNVYAFLTQDKIDKFKKDDKYVGAYIAVSKKAAYYARKRLGIPLNKIITIPNGLIIEEHLNRMRNATLISRSSFGVSEDDYLFLNVASYNLHKGHYLMAEAMEHILKTRKDIKILCIGNIIYPPHVEEFRRYIVDKGLDKHILLPGYFPNVESFYDISNAFLLPSFIEGWSIAMTEAMFYGKPMILTDTGGASEIIENNDIGIVIENEYGDTANLYSEYLDEMAYHQRSYRITASLAAAMSNFAENRSYWADAGRKAKEKVLQNYDFNKIVKRQKEVFMDVLQDRKKGRSPSKSVSERLRNPFLQALCFYLGNHLFMNFWSYKLRHWWLRKVCGITIGKDSSIHMGCFVTGSNIVIGNNTVINRGSYLDGRAGVTIGNNVNISHQTLIQTLTHDPQNPTFVCLVKPVTIKDNVWVGARAIILPGVTIGEGAVIGAGAVVSKDVPPYTIAVGNPARVIKKRNEKIEYRSRYFPYFDTDIQ